MVLSNKLVIHLFNSSPPHTLTRGSHMSSASFPLPLTVEGPPRRRRSRPHRAATEFQPRHVGPPRRHRARRCCETLAPSRRATLLRVAHLRGKRRGGRGSGIGKAMSYIILSSESNQMTNGIACGDVCISCWINCLGGFNFFAS